MPYLSNAALPPSVRNDLPSHPQEIYRAAFNKAYENHAHNRRKQMRTISLGPLSSALT